MLPPASPSAPLCALTPVRTADCTLQLLRQDRIEAISSVQVLGVNEDDATKARFLLNFDDDESPQEPWTILFKTTSALQHFVASLSELWRTLYQVELLVTGL